MNVERGTINNNASEIVLSEQEEVLPIKNITLHSVLTKAILKYSRKKRKRAEKTSSLLKDSSIENNTSHSDLTKRKCNVLFKYSRNRRKKTPSFIYHRKTIESHHSSPLCVKPMVVAGQTSMDQSDEVRSFHVLKNNVERVHVVEHAAPAQVATNVLVEMPSDRSPDDFACEESKITEIRNSANVEASVKEVKIPDLCTLEQPRMGRVTKKLLILDVNGLLADIVSYVSVGYQANIVVSGKSVFKRPFCDDFLSFCFQKFDVGVWSSRTKRNVNPLIDFIFGDSRQKLLFCWDQSHCTDTGFTTVENTSRPLFLKELKKIWEYLESTLHLNKGEYDESNTLLLDDSPYKALCNPAHTAIFPQSYGYRDVADSSLGPEGDLRLYLEQLAEAQNVQEHVAQHPFGQRAITESDPSWGFYSRIVSANSC
ncbi:hypothetical protein OIU77_001866 [Salix suchowensis]|uniref:Mitochondrial import inner membrane translocase subunit TIM50 n=1 Tax=Salix suchowensis TaxID=1278906 RepID=A0ABQ9B2V1_9ROSI|nr:hypothetical protein OIU77_001866 [Salix suchowensis]